MINKIYIRPITYEDTDYIVKWRNQEDVRTRFIYRETFTSDIHNIWMKEKVATAEVVQFIICNGNDQPIGSTYLRDIDLNNKTAEYGVFIGEAEYRGQGVGKEVLGLTLKKAFYEIGLNRIISRAISDNAPSVYSFINSGFEIESEDYQITSDGEKVPVTMMAITKEKYENIINNTSI